MRQVRFIAIAICQVVLSLTLVSIALGKCTENFPAIFR